jgi:hypothetical protein
VPRLLAGIGHRFYQVHVLLQFEAA